MPETALDLADRALGHLAGDDDAQVTVTRERSLLSRFARSRPTQATQVDDLTVHVLAFADGHPGVATTNLTDDDALRAVAARAKAAATAARHAAGTSGDHPGVVKRGQAPGDHEGFDEATAALDPALAGAALATAFARCEEQGVEAFGAWTAGEVTTAIATTTGLRVADRVTDAHFKVIARDADGRSGWGARTGSAAGAIDPDAVARRALEKLPRAEPVELPPGEYTVVLDRDAVGGLLEMLGWLAFDGLAHAEGRGALEGKLGTQIATDAITIADDPSAPGTLPRAFDQDGTPKQPLTLVEDGVARRVVHDRRSAAKAGDATASTGHALAPGGSPHGAFPTNLVLAPGDAADEHELAAGVERGLYVNRLWYLNVVHPRQVLLTGTTRDGTHLIEDGRITRPVRDVRFTDSVLRILASTDALGAQLALATEGDFYGRRFAYGTLCPPLRARGFRITG